MNSTKRASLQTNNPLRNFVEEKQAEDVAKAEKITQIESESKAKKKTTQPRPGYRQTTITLSVPALKWLGDTSTRSINDGGVSTSKNAIITALIDMAREAGLDLAGIGSEEEISERLKESFKERYAR